MLIQRTCPFTGKTNTMEIAVTEAQLADWRGGNMIQRAMPNVSADEREFIMSGITPAMWDETIGDEDDA